MDFPGNSHGPWYVASACRSRGRLKTRVATMPGVDFAVAHGIHLCIAVGRRRPESCCLAQFSRYQNRRLFTLPESSPGPAVEPSVTTHSRADPALKNFRSSHSPYSTTPINIPSREPPPTILNHAAAATPYRRRSKAPRHSGEASQSAKLNKAEGLGKVFRIAESVFDCRSTRGAARRCRGRPSERASFSHKLDPSSE